jgi:hypothetical protein
MSGSIRLISGPTSSTTDLVLGDELSTVRPPDLDQVDTGRALGDQYSTSWRMCQWTLRSTLYGSPPPGRIIRAMACREFGSSSENCVRIERVDSAKRSGE